MFSNVVRVLGLENDAAVKMMVAFLEQRCLSTLGSQIQRFWPGDG